ncbi:transmembrane protein, putative (macronuclear) [Tetrahymena thermophila SB210]|uniref:Transmembrane protein, putative n=1 Tax=Tetrahymena thermophila (strain SB210) TaxID=312017 RepID=W7XC15_TETTS|nr:transmembrane protein, putative [Tetrahymena thermophila SB210]EWS71256.1 transmembrane protein, putative [Tetrahymena thermophila SB210]|eukprot:XP_012656209.1 transmembrane protein, putative [Tetrahymena thermophila SB210]
MQEKKHQISQKINKQKKQQQIKSKINSKMKISVFALLVLVVLSVFATVAKAQDEQQKTVKLYNKTDYKVKCYIGEQGCLCWKCKSYDDILKCKYTCH